MPGTAPVRPAEDTRPSLGVIIIGILASLVGLLLAAFCYAMASLSTLGLYSWQEPTVDGTLILPLVGIAVTLPLGPLVLSAVTGHRRRWLIVAAVVSAVGVLLASLVTWIPVLLGWR